MMIKSPLLHRSINLNTFSTKMYHRIISQVHKAKCASSSFSSVRVTTRCYHGTTSNHLPNSNITTPNADPAMRQYEYWNREEWSRKGEYDYLIKISPESIVKQANILSLSDPDDEANACLDKSLPFGSKLLAKGTTLSDFDFLRDSNEKPNVIYVSPSCPKARKQLPLLLAAFPSIQWVHVRSAGIDFVMSDELSETKVPVTNAKGQFSSSLAEYTMMACSYFAKNIPRLMRQKSDKTWEKFDVEELRGKTLGIVGYGDIGRACAKLAHNFGMKIVALRRNPKLSERDPLCQVVYGTDKKSLNRLMSESDYIVCSAPSTIETRGMVNADAFQHVKENAVFINLGRGPVVDEDALIEALQNGKLKGAALDVFSEEPLPTSNPLWDLDNVLLSPHNMDQTATFMHEAAEFFVYENLPRFICGKNLLNPVDTKLGY
jgi:phosphoglycerate dehydrogenase-like enzyme